MQTCPLDKSHDGLWALGNWPDFVMVGPGFQASNSSETKDLGGLHVKKVTENYCLDGSIGGRGDGFDDHPCWYQDHCANWVADQLWHG